MTDSGRTEMSNIVIREVKPEEVAIIEDIAVQAWEPIF